MSSVVGGRTSQAFDLDALSNGSLNALSSDLDQELPQFAYDVVSKVDRKHFWYVIRNELILRLIKKSCSNWQEMSFLEVGCGTGNVIGYLYEHGLTGVSGYDRNPEGLAVCHKRYPEVPFSLLEFLSIAEPGEHFEAVGLFDVIEHIPEELTILKQARNHLVPGGKLFATVPAHGFLWSKMDEIYGHYRRYDKDGFTRALLAAGFKDVTVSYIMSPLVPLLYLRRRFMKLPDQLTRQIVIEILRKDSRYQGDFINSIMKAILRLEYSILGTRDLNFGGSLIAVAIA